jgi:4-aminobutyrate aminotransferase-like enzyme
MLWAIEFKDPREAAACVIAALGRGLMLLQSGLRGESVTIAPPPVISDVQLDRGFDLLESALKGTTVR